MSALQFRVMFRVFFLRVVDLELLAGDADPTRLVGQFAALFAGVSFLLSLPVILLGAHNLVPEQQWATEHFLLATTMATTGVLAVLHWDAALPSKVDLLVLSPLPVRRGTLFLAKTAAFLAGPGLALLTLNSISGLAWPLLFAGDGVAAALRALPAWWLTLALAGGSVVGAVLVLQGVTALLLPRRWFLRASTWIQVGLVASFLALYVMEPSLETAETLAAPGNQAMLRLLPTYWFLGLFQELHGSMQPVFTPLAQRAWMAFGATVLAMTATLGVFYVRLLPRIVEQPDLAPGMHRRSLPAWLTGGAPGEAIANFMLRTVLRSRQHRMLLSVYGGIGLAVATVYARSVANDGEKSGLSLPAMVASLLFLLLAVVGLRVAAAIPVALPANWVMQLTQVRPAGRYRRAVRRAFVLLGVAPVWGVAAVWFGVHGPSVAAGVHLAVVGLAGLLLVEVCLRGFSKISVHLLVPAGARQCAPGFLGGCVAGAADVAGGRGVGERVASQRERQRFAALRADRGGSLCEMVERTEAGRHGRASLRSGRRVGTVGSASRLGVATRGRSTYRAVSAPSRSA